MKKLLFTLLILFSVLEIFAQVPGDTIVVQAIDYTQNNNTGIRDTTVHFPTDPNITYSKVLMLYNMRCKNGLVSPPITGQTNLGCGEWDYSCNTYIEDSNRVDSTSAQTLDYLINGFTGATYNYAAQPTYNHFRQIRKNVTINNIISETLHPVGTGTISTNAIGLQNYNGKSQYLFTATEFMSAGISGGNINGIFLKVLGAGGQADNLRVRIKPTSKIVLSDTTIDNTAFNEVYFANTTLVSGSNRLQFYTPFYWDGTSNIIIEFSFTNPNSVSPISIEGSTTGNISGVLAGGDYYFQFNGNNYLEADSYKGISGTNDRTIEAWIKTTTGDKEIVSWGATVTGMKWCFRITSSGTLRLEVEGGYVTGTKIVTDNNWHHIACVFTGTNVTNALLYVDGILETVSSSSALAINTNTTTGINLRISRGTNDRYFTGIIDEVRIWNAALSVTNLKAWRYRTLSASHPNYASLAAYYPLDQNSGTSITDASINNRNLKVLNGEIWKKVNGIDLFKELTTTTDRPNISFCVGTYSQTVQNDTSYYDVLQTPNYVQHVGIYSNAGQPKNDSIMVLSAANYWQAKYEYVYNENGVLVDSIAIAVAGSFTSATITYYKRFPQKFEIMSFVTPYGINLDLGMTGKTYTFDLTDFSPILKGDRRLTMERGGQWQEQMDIKFLFIVGTPPQNVLDIKQIWPVDYPSDVSIIANAYYAPKDVLMAANGSSFKIRASVTGHGQEGEFITRDHFIDINGGADEFVWEVVKRCDENPVYPSGGTWIATRAGWCPGMATDLQEFDITSYVTPGQNANIDYGIYNATGTSNYIVSNQLVTYGALNFSLDAAVTDIIAPSNKVEYAREHPICDDPKIIIQNTGSTILTSLQIEYWVNNNPTRSIYQWTGILNPLEKQEVTLPSSITMWNIIATPDNEFHVEIKLPNGGADQYSYNNFFNSTFRITEVLPANFVIYYKTNSAPTETSYKLYNDVGTQIFFKQSNLLNRGLRDTFNLPLGCYKLVVTDYDPLYGFGDGLDFLNNYNGDGIGALKIINMSNTILKTFNPDFGASIVYNFTIDFPLSYEELYKTAEINLYPNPAHNSFTLEGLRIEDAEIHIRNILGQDIQLKAIKSTDKVFFDTSSLREGSYIINIISHGNMINKKLIIE